MHVNYFWIKLEKKDISYVILMVLVLLELKLGYVNGKIFFPIWNYQHGKL